MPKSDPQLSTIIASGASKPRRKWLIWLLILLAIGGGIWYFLKNRDFKEVEPNFLTETVEKGGISLKVTATGSLEPTNMIIVGSELSGIVNEIYVDTNDVVKVGQRLLRLDMTRLEEDTERARASLLVAEAHVNQSKATVNEAEAAYKRQQELHRISNGKTPSQAVMDTSLASLERSKADLQSAVANVAASKAQIRALEADLAKQYITSPVDGMILYRSIELGQTVAASFTAPTLFLVGEDLSKMKLVANVSEADVGKVEVGQTASFSVDTWPGRIYKGTVKKIEFGSDTLNPNSANGGGGGVVNYKTEIYVDNSDLSLRPGMTAIADISVVDKKDIITIPNSALRFDPDLVKALNGKKDSDTLVENLSPGRRWRQRPKHRSGLADSPTQVWTLKNGQPTAISVKLGITDGLVTEITDDSLEEGTEIITGVEPSMKHE